MSEFWMAMINLGFLIFNSSLCAVWLERGNYGWAAAHASFVVCHCAIIGGYLLRTLR